MPAFGSLSSFAPRPPHCLPLSWKIYPSESVKFQASSYQSLSQCPNPEVSDYSQFFLLGRGPSSPGVMSHSATVMGFRTSYSKIWPLGVVE